MGTYRANKNNVETQESVVDEEEKKKEATKKVVDKGATIALDVYTGGQFSKAKNIVSKAPVVGSVANKTWDKAVGTVSNVLSKTPTGDMINKLDDVGAVDAFDKATDIYNSVNTKNASNIKDVSDVKVDNKESKNNSDSKSFDMNNMHLTDSKIFILMFSIPIILTVVLLILFLGYDDYANLALTNDTVLAASNSSVRNCTTSEVQDKILYVGDYVVSNIKNVNSNNNNYIYSDDANYDKLSSEFNEKIEGLLVNNPIVVFSLGNNDLNNIENYITYYKHLIETYKNIKFFFMSLGPLENGLNDDISVFNQRLKDEFGNQFIDIYNNVSFAYNGNGQYDLKTYKNINDYVLTRISTNSNVVCSTGSLNNIESNLIGNNNTKILPIGSSILSRIGQEELDKWNNNIKNDVNSVGNGTGGAVALAAYDLIKTANDYGFKVPYLWGGGHGIISDGINPNWGISVRVTASGSAAQPYGSLQANGLDCSGFVSWAIKNGGCTNFSSITARAFINLSTKISINGLKTGDIAATQTHVVLILKNTGSSLIVAEAKGARYGIIINEYNYSTMLNNNYNYIDMSGYYSAHCRG